MNIKSLVDICREEGYRDLAVFGSEYELMMFNAFSQTELNNPGWKIPQEIEVLLIYQILKKRLEVCAPNLVVSGPLLVFISSICRNPAHAIMWGYTLTHLASIEATDRIGFPIFAHYFPAFLPTEEGLRKCWEAQKSSSAPLGNMLDDVNNWIYSQPQKATAGA